MKANNEVLTDHATFEAWLKNEWDQGPPAIGQLWQCWQAAIAHDREQHGKPFTEAWKAIHDLTDDPRAFDMSLADAIRFVAGSQQREEPVAWPKLTPQMMEAFRRAYKEGSIWTDRLTRAVEAMLGAAPQPAEPVKLECPKCGVDRSKSPCPGNLMDCAFKGEAQQADPVKVPDHLIERLKKHCEDKSNTAFARSSMREAIQYLSDQTTIEPVKVPSDAEALKAINYYADLRVMASRGQATKQEVHDEWERIKALLARYGAQPQPSGISGELDKALKTAEAYNADIPVTPEEDEEWQRREMK